MYTVHDMYVCISMKKLDLLVSFCDIYITKNCVLKYDMYMGGPHSLQIGCVMYTIVVVVVVVAVVVVAAVVVVDTQEKHSWCVCERASMRKFF